LHREKLTVPAEVNAFKIRRPSVVGAGKLAYDQDMESVLDTFAAEVVTVVAHSPAAMETVPRIEVPSATSNTKELFEPGSLIVSVLEVAGFTGAML
jgi:hypothetical protein